MDEEKIDRILSDLRSGLDDWDPDGEETWGDTVEMLMCEAWDGLRKLAPDGRLRGQCDDPGPCRPDQRALVPPDR